MPWKGVSPVLNRLIIFGRYPEPGRVKTRLIPFLGPAGAAELQRQLTEKVFETARAFSRDKKVQIEFCYDGGTGRKIRYWLGNGIKLTPQGTGGLGDRMARAVFRAFNEEVSRRVLLIGTDIPGLEARHLSEAFNSLDSNDLVLGPSTDGGYWLVGMRHYSNIFKEIPWSTERVISYTIALAKEAGLKVHLLPALTDIDTAEDISLSGWDKPVPRPPYISVIIPALNEEENILDAIRSAQAPDTEIIVVDGGSNDRTRSMAQQAGVKVIRGPKGRAVQQNMGASIAKGRILLFLHADTRLPANYLFHIFETFMFPGCVAGAFQFKTDLNNFLMKLIEFGTNIRARYFRLPYGDQALFVHRSTFEHIKGFPEVPVAEDLYIMRKFSKIGRIRIAPADIITSARRWQSSGIIRTTFVHLAVLFGCCMGVSSRVLSSMLDN